MRKRYWALLTMFLVLFVASLSLATKEERSVLLVIDQQVGQGVWLAHTYPNGPTDRGIPHVLRADTNQVLTPNQVVWVSGMDQAAQDGRMVIQASMLKVDVPQHYNTALDDVPYEAMLTAERPTFDHDLVLHGTVERELGQARFLIDLADGSKSVVQLDPDGKLKMGVAYSFAVHAATEVLPEGKLYEVVRVRETDGAHLDTY